MRGLVAAAALLAAACGTKGPPRAPGAKAPPAMFAPEAPRIVTEPQPGLEGAGDEDEVVPEAVPRGMEDDAAPAPAVDDGDGADGAVEETDAP